MARGGDGTATVASESAQIHTGDAIPVRLNESKSFSNTGSGPLEFMVFGIAGDMAAKQTLMAARAATASSVAAALPLGRKKLTHFSAPRRLRLE